MKNPREWTEYDLFNLPIGEFDWLEVKGRRGLDLTLGNVREHDVRENLSKALSAFANSGGGVLVFGLGDPRDHWHVDDGGVDMSIKPGGTREWLEDVIPNLVDYPLHNFNVYTIQGEGDQSRIAEGRGVFIVAVGDSADAPHQASDSRYYARVGGKSRPIPHRLVADIFGRRKDPILELELWFDTETREAKERIPSIHSQGGPRYVTEHHLVIRVRNVGRVLAHFVNVIIYIPPDLVPHALEPAELVKVDGQKYYSFVEENTRRDVVDYDVLSGPKRGPSRFDPILPGLVHTWRWKLPDDFGPEVIDLGGRLRWEVYADNATMRKGGAQLSEIPYQIQGEWQ